MSGCIRTDRQGSIVVVTLDRPPANAFDDLASREAFGRWAEPWEVANVIVFLASDYSGYMTGEIVSVSSQHP